MKSKVFEKEIQWKTSFLKKIIKQDKLLPRSIKKEKI